MRCYQTRQKLNQLNWDKSEIANNKELVEHLQNCHACASLVKAEQSLLRDFKAASVNDNEDVVPFNVLKSRVNHEATRPPKNKLRENSIMSAFSNLFSKRPKLGIGLTAAVLALVVSTLVPFNYDKTIGYEVAFAGVDRSLAMDSDKIKDLLLRLGVDDAAINVSDCEATCNVFISDLKTPNDAKIVKAAFNKIGNVQLLHDITEMVSEESGNLLKKIKLDIIATSGDESFSDEEASTFVVECIGDSLNGEMIFVTKECIVIDSNIEFGEGDFEWTAGCDTNFFSGENGEGMIIKCIKIDSGTSADNNQWISEDNNIKIIKANITGDDENINSNIPGLENINFQDLTDDEIQDLRDKGLNVEITETEDGTKVVKITYSSTDDGLETVQEDSNDEDVAKEMKDLPDGYSLSQNYPNPFNPSTSIDYSIAKSEHVSIDIININGQIVRSLVDKVMPGGNHTIEWDGNSDDGQKVASGVYLYRFVAGDNKLVKKMTLMK